MKPDNKAGFTIIETMLFLGITGLLIVGVLAGTGTSISIQRYRDSITSLQAFFQQQYSDVSNVSNDSLKNACYGDGSTNNLRGQSDCVILGRYITTTNDSSVLSVKSVIGYIPSGSSSTTNDLIALQQYRIQISPIEANNYDIEWGSSVAVPGTDTAEAFSILIVRSPLSGILRTFIDPSKNVADSDIETLVSQVALTQPAKVCVNSNGLFAGSRMAVLINAGTTSASGIETLGNDSGC
jgi:type II secretory pathway pseudopilin PulG